MSLALPKPVVNSSSKAGKGQGKAWSLEGHRWAPGPRELLAPFSDGHRFGSFSQSFHFYHGKSTWSLLFLPRKCLRPKRTSVVLMLERQRGWRGIENELTAQPQPLFFSPKQSKCKKKKPPKPQPRPQKTAASQNRKPKRIWEASAGSVVRGWRERLGIAAPWPCPFEARFLLTSPTAEGCGF